MVPWEILDEVATPDGKGVMHLARRGHEYVIRVDRRDLMSSRMHGSEDTLATHALNFVGRDAHVMVGGLGLGFTARAALDAFAQGRVTVVELLDAVVRWNREHLGHLANHPLDDPRLGVEVGDVVAHIGAAENAWNAILLDVDNGPDALTQPTNAWLYTPTGLAACRRALKSGGVLGVWSAFDDPRFTQRLKAAGFRVDVVQARAHGKRGAKHTLWFAQV